MNYKLKVESILSNPRALGTMGTEEIVDLVRGLAALGPSGWQRPREALGERLGQELEEFYEATSPWNPPSIVEEFVDALYYVTLIVANGYERVSPGLLLSVKAWGYFNDAVRDLVGLYNYSPGYSLAAAYAALLAKYYTRFIANKREKRPAEEHEAIRTALLKLYGVIRSGEDEDA